MIKILFFFFKIKFDRFADGYENHHTRDHHLWYYVYYIYNITIKPVGD
jgi:hypothetical protein